MRIVTQNIIVAMTFLGLCLSGPVLGLASLPRASHGLVLVLSGPWADREAAIAAAGGHGVGPTWAPMATLAQAGNPDFGDRLREAGAFLVVDGTAVAKFCGVTG
ncbi:hypothetical protein [Pseudooceanicola algae]|uniref:Uncharacterized protein n=1 Tax=Pseudooceanicola algae TaxID=1537215 RepID=A0A418SG08_9RHOB|nr:hypothetical protein [Pseudooceanicola algae]QPM91607.1 hypothetical protein PSAL_028620 [Pseudooceanicola algae]